MLLFWSLAFVPINCAATKYAPGLFMMPKVKAHTGYEPRIGNRPRRVHP
jgi:hypothetical protein